MDEMVKADAKKPEAKRENKVSQTQKTCPSQSISSPVEQILFLQRTTGNQAVARLIESGALHARLRNGQPGDIYEQEADRVAEHVMRMNEPLNFPELVEPIIQKMCLICEEEELQKQRIEEEENLMTKADNTRGIANNLESSIQALRGRGKPLPESMRAFFEPRFGYDFSGVRIHTAAPAAHLVRAVDARAFTMGHDVFFGAGEYQPQTDRGKSLMSHELAHVIQQRGITRQIQRVYKPLLPPGDCTPAEHRALQDTVNHICKVKRGCDQNDDCPAILQKIQANADCIKARVIINAKCFRGGDAGHILAVGAALGSLANCWIVYNRKCQVKTPPPVLVPVPEKIPKPVVDKSFMEKMAAITGLTGTALVIYLIISEGSRLFPPRNLVPVP